MGKEYHFGLIGFPIAHSLSPLLHRAALQAAGKRGDYRLLPVVELPQGDEQLRSEIEKIRSGELDGVNITVPHKQNVLSLVDSLSPTAKAVGAVNTIYKRGSIIFGGNTDVDGFLNDLARIGVKNQVNQLAFVLGAGGAARAVTWGLLTSGWRVIILARRQQQGQQLVDWICSSASLFKLFTTKQVSSYPLEVSTVEKLVDEEPVHLIVNATPLGMASHPQGSAWPVKISFPKEAVIYDLVYTPPETELIKQAQQSGLSSFNGLGMLVEQAALAFEVWTKIPAPREAMWRVVEDLEMMK